MIARWSRRAFAYVSCLGVVPTDDDTVRLQKTTFTTVSLMVCLLAPIWGAFYIFKSEEIIEKYLKSELWVKEIPERWGLKPEITVVDPGPILCKEYFQSCQ